MNGRMAIKISQIVRLRAAGVKDLRIAEYFNMSNSGLQRILRTPEYLEAEEAYMNGHLSAMDKSLAGKREVLEQHLREQVPEALKAIADAVRQRRDLRMMMEAAKEVLDRDPDKLFPKGKSASQGEAANALPRLPDEVMANIKNESDRVTAILIGGKPGQA